MRIVVDNKRIQHTKRFRLLGLRWNSLKCAKLNSRRASCIEKNKLNSFGDDTQIDSHQRSQTLFVERNFSTFQLLFWLEFINQIWWLRISSNQFEFVISPSINRVEAFPFQLRYEQSNEVSLVHNIKIKVSNWSSILNYTWKLVLLKRECGSQSQFRRNC